MPIIHYIEADGSEYEAEVSVGSSVMQGAVDNMIDGILAECGGACRCATCHCYVDEQWLDRVGAAEGVEKELLEAAVDIEPNSRLSCQIEVTEELDGLVVRLPVTQYKHEVWSGRTVCFTTHNTKPYGVEHTVKNVAQTFKRIL